MKQSNEKKESGKMIISLATKKGTGYKVAKAMARKFTQEGVSYKLIGQSKNSTRFGFDGFYIKIYHPYYENGVFEVRFEKVTTDAKKILELAISMISEFIVDSENNCIFLSSYKSFVLNNKYFLPELKKKVYSDYYLEQEGKIFSLCTKLTYKLKATKRDDGIYCEDSLILSMPVQATIVTFIPCLIFKFYCQKEIARDEILAKIESI